MQRPRLLIIIGLLGAGTLLVMTFLLSGLVLSTGSPPATAGQPPREPVAGSHAPTLLLHPVTRQTPVPLLTRSPVITTLRASVSEEMTPPSLITIAGDPYPISIKRLEQRVHELINQQRTIGGLAVLILDPVLSDIARDHSEDMAALNYFAHVNPGGENPTDRAADAGYNCRKDYSSYYTYGIAENIFQNNLYSSTTYFSNGKRVYDWSSPEEIARTTVGDWMNSTGHRENILTPSFDREGIGVAIAADNKVYITEDFC